MVDLKKIVCYSGGKDSTAMLIYLLENQKQVDDIIYVDMDEWMWFNSINHIRWVAYQLNCKIHIINAMEEIKKGFERYGFPSFFNRWCTGIKRDLMRDYIKEKYPNEEIIQYIGYTADEDKRIGKNIYTYGSVEYPLVDAGITSDETLEMCQKYNLDFNEVYNHHSHYNCWLCPLQKISELEYICNNLPDEWEYLRKLQNKTDGYFQNGKSIFEFEHKFWLNKQEELREKRMLAREKYRQRGG